MVAPCGPDDETWRRMGPRAKKVYWTFAALIAGWVVYLWLMA